MGCCLSVKRIDGEKISVAGNSCAYGANYAETEINNPVRVLTTTVMAENGTQIPVRTLCPIPKQKLFDAMREVKMHCVKLPVVLGQVIIENIAQTGVDLIATKTIDNK